MTDLLTKYWIEISADNWTWATYGVTAYSKEDALNIIKSYLPNKSSFEVLKVIENFDISTLDQNHIVPNIGSPFLRGIWHPHVNN